MKRTNCKHDEQHLLDASGRGRSGVQVNAHDCDYVDARNAPITAAERMATATLARRNSPEWSREFVWAMDRLARERGLVKNPFIRQ